MAIVSLLFLVVALFLIGVGIAAGLAACAAAVALTGLGVISSSVLVGFRKGRAADGIRAFLLQCGIIAGIPAGAFCAWLAAAMINDPQGAMDWQVFAVGGLGGALAGVLVALALDRMSRRLHAWAITRMPAISGGS